MAKNQPTQKGNPVKPAVRQTPTTVKSKSTNNNGSYFKSPSSDSTPIFDKTNYIILGIGALLIILGFILMSGGNTDPNVFNEKEIYSTQRITVAPITVIAGFIVIIFAILKKPSTAINDEL